MKSPSEILTSDEIQAFNDAFTASREMLSGNDTPIPAKLPEPLNSLFALREQAETWRQCDRDASRAMYNTDKRIAGIYRVDMMRSCELVDALDKIIELTIDRITK